MKAKRGEFEFGVRVRERMIKTLSPFPVVAARRGINAQVCENDAKINENCATVHK